MALEDWSLRRVRDLLLQFLSALSCCSALHLTLLQHLFQNRLSVMSEVALSVAAIPPDNPELLDPSSKVICDSLSGHDLGASMVIARYQERSCIERCGKSQALQTMIVTSKGILIVIKDRRAGRNEEQ